MGKIAIKYLLLLSLALALPASVGFAAGKVPLSFSLSGTLYQHGSSSVPLSESGIILRVQIIGKSTTCVLYDEEQTVDTSASSGAFSIRVGTALGSARRKSGSDPGNAMAAIFQNAEPITAIGCASGSTYSPADSDERLVRIFVTPNSGAPDQLYPDLSLGSSSFSYTAERAETLQGISKAGFVQTDASSALSQANVDYIFTLTNYPILKALVDGGGASTGGTNTGSYVISAGSGGTDQIDFRVGGSSRASISSNGTFSAGNGAFTVDGASHRLGLGSSNPSFDLSLGGDTGRTIGMERASTSNTAGSGMLLNAGSAGASSSDKSGGDLVLSAGGSAGNAGSNIYLKTATPGASGSTANLPSTKLTILGNGNIGVGTASPSVPLHVIGEAIVSKLSLGWSSFADLNLTTNGTIYQNGGDAFTRIQAVGNGNARLQMQSNGPSGGATDSGHEAGRVDFGGNNGSSWLDQAASIKGIAESGWSASNNPMAITFSTTSGTGINEVVRIKGNGNVGIGVTNPGAKLEIGGTSGVDGIKFPDGTIQTSAATGGSGGVGVGQAWSHPSRTLNTSYQNTTGKPIMVVLSVSGNNSVNETTFRIDASTDGSTWISVGSFSTANYLNWGNASAIIPNSHYYRYFKSGPNTNDVETYSELR